MLTAAEYLLKVSLVLIGAAGIARASRRRTSAAIRHGIYALAVTALLALPFLASTLPAWPVIPLRTGAADATAPGLPVTTAPGISRPQDVPAGRASDPVANMTSATTVASVFPARPGTSPVRVPWIASLVLVYAAGVCLLLARLAWRQRAVSRLVHQSTPLDAGEWQTLVEHCAARLALHRRVRVLLHSTVAMPMTVGLRAHAVILPVAASGWSNERRRAVLLHELAHVVRRDCLMQTAAALATAVYWLHPGTWWLERRLRTEREFACDDLVVASGFDACDYAGHLLDIAHAAGPAQPLRGALAMAAPHQVERRILALLDGEARRRLTPAARLAAIAAFAVLLLPTAVLTADGQAANGASTQSKSPVRPAGGSWQRLLDLDYWQERATFAMSQFAEHMQYVAEMRTLGYSAADPNVLFEMRRHGVTPDYVRELVGAGLTGLSSDELLQAAAHGITGEYVRDLKQLHYEGVDLKALIRLGSHGVDGQFIRGLEQTGFSALSLEVLIRMQSHGVSPDFIEEMHGVGYRWSIDDLVQARSHGIDAAYVSELVAIGYSNLPLADLVKLRSHGVTAIDAKAANARAGALLSVDQLTHLASIGWTR